MLHLARRVASLFRERPRPPEPIELSREDTARARFCFVGEFGYEMISWLPYLRFLKDRLNIVLRTAGRPGSSAYYCFSDDHVELPVSLLGDVWGDPESYRTLQAQFPGELLVHPGKEAINERRIAVDGFDWRTRNIHARVDETHYARLDYRDVPPWAPITGRDIVVINNKYYRQWPSSYEAPINYFAPADLERLRDVLVDRGYAVVYNHFVERTEDVSLPFDDRAIFRRREHCFDLRDAYAGCRDAAERNRLQLAVYNACVRVIGPQGGNLYVPAICRRPLLILMRDGDYLDYTELGRLYDIDVDVFYEPRHILHWIQTGCGESCVNHAF